MTSPHSPVQTGQRLVVVQIGVNRARDDLTDLLRYIGYDSIDKLVLVEPLHIHSEAILDCYRDIERKLIVNAAVVPRRVSLQPCQSLDFWYHKNDHPFYELASTSKDHIRKHARTRPELADESGFVCIKVQCIDINNLLRMIGLSEVDILFIDAEGLDSDIIKSIDLDSTKIRHIFFENLHLPEGRASQGASIYQFLSEKGMHIRYKCMTNGWMSHAFQPGQEVRLSFLSDYM